MDKNLNQPQTRQSGLPVATPPPSLPPLTSLRQRCSPLPTTQPLPTPCSPAPRTWLSAWTWIPGPLRPCGKTRQPWKSTWLSCTVTRYAGPDWPGGQGPGLEARRLLGTGAGVSRRAGRSSGVQVLWGARACSSGDTARTVPGTADQCVLSNSGHQGTLGIGLRDPLDSRNSSSRIKSMLSIVVWGK